MDRVIRCCASLLLAAGLAAWVWPETEAAQLFPDPTGEMQVEARQSPDPKLQLGEAFEELFTKFMEALTVVESVLQALTPEDSRRVEWTPGSSFRDQLLAGVEGPEMVVLPAGNFRMGCVSGMDCCVDEEPVCEVVITSPFAMSKYEVTFEDYDRFTYPDKVDDEGWGRSRRPVINVSWDDATAYAAWFSEQTGKRYRLPTEAEWEYAARAGSATKYSWGNDIGHNRANCAGCGSQWDDEQTAPVGSFSPNAWGLHDMHGNIDEWVQDCWHDSCEGAPHDGSAWTSGDCSQRVSRGGSWFNVPWALRTADRNRGIRTLRSIYTGFRLVRDL